MTTPAIEGAREQAQAVERASRLVAGERIWEVYGISAAPDLRADLRLLLSLATDALRNPDGPEAAEALASIRLQGQAEGFAAAVQWLRDRSAMKPAPTLSHAASILADQMEQSRIPASARALLETDHG